MNGVIIVLSILLSQLPIHESTEEYSQRLTLSIFYESLCGDCVDLFKQLQRLLQVEDIRKKVKFELVPYGKAYQAEAGRFYCQHGASECFLNNIHGCANRDLNYEDSLDFIVCMMSNCDDQYRCLFKECAFAGRINPSQLLRCAVENGHEIMNEMRSLSDSYDYVKQFVPTVVINHYYRPDVQEDALRNLTATVLLWLNE